MRGMDAAAAEHGFPVQLCMTLPAITLASAGWGSVTNARLQGDGYATNSERYDIFQTSLLYASLDLAPFLDNVWTTSCQPAPDNAYGNATCEGDVEALWAIATLSAGPVGFGDRAGATNAPLLAMAARADGVLLQPSAPALPLDAWFADGLPAAAGARARIAVAPSLVPRAAAGGAAALFLSVLGVFLAAPVPVAPVDVSPPLAPVGEAGISAYYTTALSRRAACAAGAPAAAGCAARFAGTPADALLTLNTGAAAHEVVSVAPVFSAAACGVGGGSGGGGDGWALLGELAKITRVSPSRVAGLDPGCTARAAPPPAPALCVAVVGGAGEAVDLAFVDAGGILRTVSVRVGDDGAASVVCACEGAAGACACAQEA
jgi:hypothetical protein